MDTQMYNINYAMFAGPNIFALYIRQGRMQDFSRGGAQLKIFFEVGYTCRKAACREQRSCEPLLGGFGGMLPQENF